MTQKGLLCLYPEISKLLNNLGHFQKFFCSFSILMHYMHLHYALKIEYWIKVQPFITAVAIGLETKETYAHHCILSYAYTLMLYTTLYITYAKMLENEIGIRDTSSLTSLMRSYNALSLFCVCNVSNIICLSNKNAD